MTSEQSNFDEAWQYCLNILSSKDYTVDQIYNKLDQRDVPPGTARGVVDKLKSMDYLNDERFARNYCDSRVRLKNEGPYKIEKALKRKGVSEETISLAIDEMKQKNAFSEALENALSKWLRINGEPDEVNELRRLNDFLMRKGFDGEIISDCLVDYKREIFD